MEFVDVAFEVETEVAEELGHKLRDTTCAEVVRADTNRLDGGLGTALLLLTTLNTTITALTPLIVFYSHKVRKIKVGDVEIENPTAAQVERLLGPRTGKEPHAGRG